MGVPSPGLQCVCQDMTRTNEREYSLIMGVDIFQMNNYIVRSYRDVIVITKFATRRASKAQSIVMY